MEDGKKIPHEITVISHITLAASGWWLFKIPDPFVGDIASWIYELHPNAEKAICNFYFAENILSIRRYEDATLFKLSWEECHPLYLDKTWIGIDKYKL